MTASLAFALLSLSVLPWWGLWLAAPRSRLAARAASHGAIFLVLCSVYAGLVAAALAAQPPAGLGFDGLRAALATPRGFLAGWTHYLAFDLFVGAWIVREAQRLDLGARPYLVFALLLGPIGLGAFLARRWLLLRRLGQLGEGDIA